VTRPAATPTGSKPPVSWPSAAGGKAPTFAAIEEADPLDLADAEKAAEEFTAKILRLASDQESDRG
jgi:hypothetical protein